MSKKTFYLRNLLLLLLIFILIVSVGYKYLEWKTFNELAKLQDYTIPNELAILEEDDNLQQDVITDFIKLSDPKSTLINRLTLYDQLDGKINLVLDNEKSYIEAIKNNSQKYNSLNSLSKLLVGNRGKLARRIILDQLNYYKKEINSVYNNIVGTYLLKNIFAVSKDKVIMEVYDKKASSSPKTLYSKYFSDIAPLEKYTRSDFKFPEEDTIKDLYPYGYESLQNNKDYMKTYYAVIKDFVAGDYESAAYKQTKLQEQYIKLNIDMDRLLRENESVNQERSKQIIELVVDKVAAIKEFKNKNFGNYPLLPTIKGWKEDLEMCQIYLVKGNLVSDISKKPIDAKDVTTYLDWLSKRNPSTSSVDNLVNKKIIKFTNSDDKLIYQCLEQETGKKYTFVIIK